MGQLKITIATRHILREKSIDLMAKKTLGTKRERVPGPWCHRRPIKVQKFKNVT